MWEGFGVSEAIISKFKSRGSGLKLFEHRWRLFPREERVELAGGGEKEANEGRGRLHRATLHFRVILDTSKDVTR